MSGAVSRYLDLLEAEREAACRAEVDRLVQLQRRKRALLEPLRRQPPSPEEAERIAARSRANLRLLRHLAECFRALGGAEEPEAVRGYDARGRRALGGRAP